MTHIAYHPATSHALEHIARHMRADDVDELRIMGKDRPREAVFRSAMQSDVCFVAYVDGVPGAVFGVGTPYALGRVGAPWLLGTDVVERHARAMLVDGRQAVESWRRRYALLQNAVSVSNILSIRWLSRLGFEFGEPVRTPYGGYVKVFSMEGRDSV